MEQYIIYARPSDYPSHFVVRRATIRLRSVHMHDPPHALKATLEEARDTLPEGLVRINRQEQDDPVIVEVWI